MGVYTRAHSKVIDEHEQAAVDLAIKLSSADASFVRHDKKPVSKKTKLPARSRKSTKGKISSSTIVKVQRVHHVKNQKSLEAKRAPKPKSLMVKLPVKYYNIGYKVLREKYGIKIKREKVTYTNEKRFKLGHNPFAGTSLHLLSETEALHVYSVLVNHNKRFGFGSFTSQPAHAAQSKPIVTIDSIIQVMLSQTTANELAIDTHDRLRNRYVYVVDGKKYAGIIPNWHKVRLLPEEDLRHALVPGGQFNKRAKAIKELLDFVYNANLARMNLGKGSYKYVGNPPDAKDFVDGMLSMEFITADYEDDSDQAILDRLLKLPNFGSKSAMCILAFQLKRDLFVVDVHVLRFCKWLGWIPKTAKAEDAAMYLHKVIPKHIRYDFHNQIWTHCANENVRESRGRRMVCPFCGSNPPPSGKDFSKIKCPLEPYLPLLEKRWSREYRSKKEDLVDEIETKVEIEDLASVVDSEASGEPKKEMKQSEMDTLQKTGKAKPGAAADPDTRKRRSTGSASSLEKSNPVREKKLKVRRTMLMDELTPEQAKVLHRYLFMFRPLDNSFGQDRGTFETKPRFRWEGAEIMDPDVAVRYEVAVRILKGQLPHPWIRYTEEDFAKQQALNAIVAASNPLPGSENTENAVPVESLADVMEWEATDDEMDGETLVDLMDEDTWENVMEEESADETISEEMRSWQIDNLE